MEGSWKGGCVLLVVCGGSRAQIHPQQQVLEARVIAENVGACDDPALQRQPTVTTVSEP